MSKRVHLAIAVMVLTLSACAQPKEDPRVAELQKELATMKQDLAANKDAQAGAAAGQAATAGTAGSRARDRQVGAGNGGGRLCPHGRRECPPAQRARRHEATGIHAAGRHGDSRPHHRRDLDQQGEERVGVRGPPRKGSRLRRRHPRQGGSARELHRRGVRSRRARQGRGQPVRGGKVHCRCRRQHADGEDGQLQR